MACNGWWLHCMHSPSTCCLHTHCNNLPLAHTSLLLLPICNCKQVLLQEVGTFCAGSTSITTNTSQEEPAASAPPPASCGEASAASTSLAQPQSHTQPAPQQQQQQQQHSQHGCPYQVLGGAVVESEYCTFLGEPSDLDWAPQQQQQQQQQQQRETAGDQEVAPPGSAPRRWSGWSMVANAQQHLASLTSKVGWVLL
jgi:hypothetical protein